jgi:signal transduction histidine kinase
LGFDFVKTGALIYNLLPKTKHLFVISGVSMMDQNLKKLAVKALSGLENKYVIHYIDSYTKQDLLLKVAHLPKDSAIFFISLFRDVSGQSFVPRDVMAEVSQKANSPVFSMVDTYLGYGTVGGALLSASYQGKKYAEMVVKILAGESLANLQYTDKGNQLMFDWQQLKRCSIDESRLPIGSIVRYRKLSTWEEHQWKIVGVSIIIVMQALAMIGLLIQHKRRRRAEEEAQKLRDERAHISRVLAMGEIAASLAHEINQPLSAIRSYAQAAQRFLKNDPAEASKALSGIITGNRRAEEVIKRIRMSLKKEPFKQTRIQLKGLVEEVIELATSKAQEQNISLKSELILDFPATFGDRIQLQQVLFNLILNAIEAITDKNNTHAEVVVLALQENTQFTTLSIRDTGMGIDEQKANSLFDAFYTTKAEGLGIGLSISRSIIEDHSGRLWATNNDDIGSTFSFTIPICEDDKK